MSEKSKIILAFSLSIIIMIILGIYSYKNMTDYKNFTDLVNNTKREISQAERLSSDIQHLETLLNVYLTEDNEKYTQTLQEILKNIENTDLLLANPAVDYSPQHSLLNSIHNDVRLKIDFTKKTLSIIQKEGFKSGLQFTSSGMGKNLSKNIMKSIRNFIYNENNFLSEKLTKSDQNFSSAITVIITSICLTILIILTTLYFFIRDYNKRIYFEKKLVESELRLKKFLDSMPIGVFVLDREGKPYYANNKSKEILGKGIIKNASQAELSEIYKAYVAGTENIYPPYKQPIVRALKGEKNICVEDIEILKNGIRIPVRVNATPITNSEDTIEYAIAVFDDISNIKEAEHKLIHAKKLAEESVILKDTFLANMSHEIRTPMNAIIGFTDLLMKKQLQIQEKEYVQIIKTSGENLLRIINDILDVSKIESGMMAFEEYPISIKEIFSSLNIMISNKAKEKNIKLSFDYDANIPNTLLGDPTRLTQIILNLVGNAIKFTKKGSVDVFSRIIKEEEDVFYIEFSIKDTGIGIPEDRLNHIFERFTQAETHTTRNYGGTGLGLSIAKQLIELQGGKITIKSILGIGSEFTFVLPFKKTDEIHTNIQKIYSEINIQELSKLNILVAEDNPINIKFILSLFSDYNIKADIAENGKIAIEKIKNYQYDIILMDIEMPEMNGYETTTTIRKTLKNDTPIIAMTAHAMAGEKEKCLKLGMNDYISKPIKAELLFEKMLISISQKRKIINLDFLVQSMRKNKNTIRDVIDIFIQQVPKDLALINEAATKLDYHTIKMISHKMKSTVSLMGIQVLENILDEMEILGQAENEIERIRTLNNSLNKLIEQAMHEIQIEKLNYT